MKILSYLLFDDTNVLSLLIVVAVSIGIIWLIREIVCWYWKVNDIINQLKEVNSKLEILTSKGIRIDNSPIPAPPVELEPRRKFS